MQKMVVGNGQCVACGRHAAHGDTACPFCGDPIWRPGWWHTIRVALLVLPPIIAVTLGTWLVKSELKCLTTSLSTHPLCGLLLAGGIALLLLPPPTNKMIVVSSRELRNQQLHLLALNVVAGIYTALGTMTLRLSALNHALPAILAATLCASVCLLPFFTRVSWRMLPAVGLMALAFALVST